MSGLFWAFNFGRNGAKKMDRVWILYALPYRLDLRDRRRMPNSLLRNSLPDATGSSKKDPLENTLGCILFSYLINMKLPTIRITATTDANVKVRMLSI